MTSVFTAAVRANSRLMPRPVSHRNMPKEAEASSTVTKPMRQSMKPFTSGSRGSRGGRAIRPGSGRSKAMASDRVTAVTMFTHRICTGVIGRVMPSSTAISTIEAWATLVGNT